MGAFKGLPAQKFNILSRRGGGTEVGNGSKLTAGIGDLHTRACAGGSSKQRATLLWRRRWHERA
jgi:hypothetical protein